MSYLLVAWALIVSLALFGFAHRVPGTEQVLQAAVVLQADICGDGDGNAEEGCPACRLASAFALAMPAVNLIVLELGLDAEAVVPRHDRRASLVPCDTRCARGPPIG
ncbi:hypothetical protein [Sagittula sp. S175]|uniref:hypothetical protein n=1 Tax=Sagittula sp. S175 TaxID=3415129 RepID=UPI003C79E3A4